MGCGTARARQLWAAVASRGAIIGWQGDAGGPLALPGGWRARAGRFSNGGSDGNGCQLDLTGIEDIGALRGKDPSWQRR